MHPIDLIPEKSKTKSVGNKERVSNVTTKCVKLLAPALCCGHTNIITALIVQLSRRHQFLIIPEKPR